MAALVADALDVPTPTPSPSSGEGSSRANRVSGLVTS